MLGDFSTQTFVWSSSCFVWLFPSSFARPSEVNISTSARNGNVEVPVYFLKAKQGYTVRKLKKKGKWIWYIMISAGMKFRNKNKSQYGIPTCTGPFRAPILIRFFCTKLSLQYMAYTVYHSCWRIHYIKQCFSASSAWWHSKNNVQCLKIKHNYPEKMYCATDIGKYEKYWDISILIKKQQQHLLIRW
jgi:hypothetical protein